MTWRIHYSPLAIRNLDALDKHISRKLTNYLRDRISTLVDPRAMGKALKGSTWGDCWRYRCVDYRIIVDIIDRDVLIHVMRIGDRKGIY
jgi:mRNA interferase RelE/StbE